jgi:hypothetical protein
MIGELKSFAELHFVIELMRQAYKRQMGEGDWL